MAEDTHEPRATAVLPHQLVAPQQFALDVLLEKYAKGDEQSADDVFKRVARGVARRNRKPCANRWKRSLPTTCGTARLVPGAS